jgi:asparagine synthetase B (glutamine-hydrolysing)
MDFLISQSELSERAEQRYDETVATGAFDVRYATSGNLEVFDSEDPWTGLTSGILFGPLADEAFLQDADVEALGRVARESDGSFVVVLPRDDEVLLLTDAGGSIPVYYGRGPKGFAAGTLVHHVAAASGCTALDRVSVVDYLFHQTVCYPYSWYKDVRVVPPGSVCTFGPRDRECHTYWRPHEPSDLYEPSDEHEWGERLRSQVQNAIQLSLSGNESARVMYSGGADSRAVLSLVPDSFECIPTTILSGGQGHREYELARRSANLLGREIERIPRPDGYYRSNVEQRIDTIGPGWDLRHTHVHGSVSNRFEDVDVVFGGYLADTLFKTHYMSNVVKRNDWGRSERLLDPMPDDVEKPDFQSGRIGMWNDYAMAAKRRRNEHHEKISKFRPRTAGNWHSLWPLRPVAYAHYLTCLRMGIQVVEPFLWNKSYQLAAQMPDTCRVNRNAYRKAFAEEMGRAGYVVTSSGRVPRLSDGGVTGAVAETVASYLRSWPTIKRGIKARVLGGYSGPQGPWHPDSGGWRPVCPERHFSQKGHELLLQRLSRVLAEGQVSRFFGSRRVSAPMQVRALALGLCSSGVDS